MGVIYIGGDPGWGSSCLPPLVKKCKLNVGRTPIFIIGNFVSISARGGSHDVTAKRRVWVPKVTLLSPPHLSLPFPTPSV